jgi:hypothetical protein
VSRKPEVVRHRFTDRQWAVMTLMYRGFPYTQAEAADALSLTRSKVRTAREGAERIAHEAFYIWCPVDIRRKKGLPLNKEQKRVWKKFKHAKKGRVMDLDLTEPVTIRRPGSVRERDPGANEFAAFETGQVNEREIFGDE